LAEWLIEHGRIEDSERLLQTDS